MRKPVKRILAYIIDCPACGYEGELVDNIEEDSGSLKTQGYMHCPKCGEEITFPLEEQK